MLFCKPDVNKLKRKKDVKRLIRALRYKDPDVRWSAANSLASLYSSGCQRAAEAVDSLIERLGDSEPSVRDYSVKALGAIKDRRAIIPILGYITSIGELADRYKAWEDDYQYFSTAMEALASLKAADTLPDVLRAVVASKVYLYEINREALEHFIEISSANALHAALSVDGVPSNYRADFLQALVRRGDTRALEPLLDLLKTGHGFDRRSAAKSLGKLGHSSAVDPLAGLLCDADRFLAQTSLQVLRTVFNWTPRTAKEAAWALVTGTEEGRKYDHDYREIYDTWARDSADKLMRWGTEAIDEFFLAFANPERILNDEECLRVLGYIRDPRSIPVLRMFAEGNKKRLALLATGILIRVGGPDVVSILRVIADTPRKVLTSILSYDRTTDMDFWKTIEVDNDHQRKVASAGLTTLRERT